MQNLRLLVMALLLLSGTATWSASDVSPWSFWASSDDSNLTSIDHNVWGEFLEKNVHFDESGINKVGYTNVTAADRTDLQNYIRRLSLTDPRKLRKDEQLAYWINLYNALTVAVVLDNPDKKSIRKMGRGLFSSGPWRDELVEIAGQNLTLDDIEHRILRPIWQDHRIHFAVNCASLGCPNLGIEAYTAENAERLFNLAEHDYINHERGVRFDAAGQVHLSQIFNWYQSDFASDENELLIYLSRHHDELADRLRSFRGKIRYDYDWSLNACNSDKHSENVLSCLQ